MKTTNYEISKQLAEARFKANQVWNQEGQFWGYDLETILEALPKEIELEDDDYYFTMGGYYGRWKIAYQVSFKVKYILTTSKNESLADTAARLLLLLHKKDLIKF